MTGWPRGLAEQRFQIDVLNFLFGKLKQVAVPEREPARDDDVRELLEAIRAGSVPSFQTLCATTRDQFYNRDPGTNYAQARYLCYWLQERDLLRRFYRAFRDRHREDPGGYAILTELLGAPDMRAWQAEWERYILGLRFG